MLAVIGAFVLAAPYPAQGPGGDTFPRDQRLERKLTVHAKVMPLSDLVRDLSRETGVEIGVAPAIADRKLTLLFEDQPAAIVMARVSSLFFANWKPVKTGYFLTIDSAVRREEDDLKYAEQQVAGEQIAKFLEGLAALDGTSDTAIVKERLTLSKEAARLREEQSSSGRERLGQIDYRLAILQAKSWAPFARALSTSMQVYCQQLSEGETLFASTRSDDDVPRLPSEFLPKGGIWPDASPDVIAQMHYVPSRRQLAGLVNVLGTQGGGSGMPISYKLPDIDANGKKAKLLQRLSKWATATDPSILSTTLKLTAVANESSSPILSLADHLAYLHDHSGVQIIADAFRLVCSVDGPLAAKTVGEYLVALAKDKPADIIKTKLGYVRTESGWLLVRHKDYWRYFDSEIPEKVLLGYEQLSARRPLTLDEYASFAGNLTELQLASFQDRGFDIFVKFPVTPLVSGSASLRFWSSLNADQRQAALGNGLLYRELNESQQNYYASAIRAMLWRNPIKAELLPIFFKSNRRQPPNLSFFCEQKVGPVQSQQGLSALLSATPPSEKSTGLTVAFLYGVPPNGQPTTRIALVGVAN